MPVRGGINDVGRIGRGLRAALVNGADIEVVAVNDMTDAQTLATLPEWDSIGEHLDQVAVDDCAVVVADRLLQACAPPDSGAITWSDAGVDVAIEAPGRHAEELAAAKHLDAGAKQGSVSAPVKGDAPTFALGVDDDGLGVERHDLFSNGSCTTNSLAPLAKVLSYLQDSEAPLVPADIVGNPRSSTFHAPLTTSVGRQVKVRGCLDPWGFSNRLVEFAAGVRSAR